MILYSALAAIAFIPGWTGLTIPAGWAFLSVTLPWFLWRKASSGVPSLLGLTFLAYAGLSLGWAGNSFDAIFALWQIGIAAMAFRLGMTLTSSRGVFLGLAIGLLPSSALAVAQWYCQGGECAHWSELVLRGDLTKSAGLFFNSVVFGTVCALVIVGAICHRIWWAIPTLVPGLILAESRASTIALALTLVMTIMRQWWLLIGVALGALFWIATSFNHADDFRISIWTSALNGLTPFGHGPGAYMGAYFVEGHKLFHLEHAHSEVLNFAFEYGLGCLPLAGLVLWLLGRSDDDDWPVFICFLILCLISWPLHSPVPAFVGALVAGRLCATGNVAWSLGVDRGRVFLGRLAAA